MSVLIWNFGYGFGIFSLCSVDGVSGLIIDIINIFRNVYFIRLVEHGLLVFNSFQKSDLERTQCNLNVSYWETLYGRERPHLRIILPYQPWALPVLEVICKLLKFARIYLNSSWFSIPILVAEFNTGLSSIIYRCLHHYCQYWLGCSVPTTLFAYEGCWGKGKY